MTSIGGAGRTPNLTGIMSTRIREGVISGARTTGAKGLAGLMARFEATRPDGPRPQPLDSGRLAFRYPAPRGGRPPLDASALAGRMDRFQGQMGGVESMQEQVRNKRQMASTAFQNFDQKANQLYNLLSSVMKAMNEMRMGTVRNML